MRDQKWLQDDVATSTLLHTGPFLPCQTKAQTCDIDGLKCSACLVAKAQRRPTSSVSRQDPALRFQHQLEGYKPRSLKRNHIAPGDCVSADHYLSPINKRLYSSFGREPHGYTCGSLFVDHASGKIFNFPQLSTTAAETVRSKHTLERLAFDDGIQIKSIHSDNGVFASNAFRDDCNVKSQKLTFSGVGAHHQNGVVERNIKTVSQWARANMLHAAFHWPTHANIKLWPQAVNYAVWVFNRLPNMASGLSPNELWSQSRNSNYDLRRTHPFGCPVYVLDPVLQDGNKLPKWSTRARKGMFVGFSAVHSSLVPLVLNITTGKITPQFHVIFDDKFQTVASLPTGTTLRDKWLNLLKFSHDNFCDDTHIDDDGPAILPPEFNDWFQDTADPTPHTGILPSLQTVPPIVVELDDHIELVNQQHPPFIDSQNTTDDSAASVSEGDIILTDNSDQRELSQNHLAEILRLPSELGKMDRQNYTCYQLMTRSMTLLSRLCLILPLRSLLDVDMHNINSHHNAC